MNTISSSRIKWLALVLLTGMTSCSMAGDHVATYEIGWDEGPGNLWHTVPKLIQGASTIYFTNQGIKSDVSANADGGQVFKTEIETEDGDLLAFTESSSSSRHYVIKGEARCENVSGKVSMALGVSNANFAGIVGTASATNGKEVWWQGTEDWQPFTITCDLQPALRPASAADPNRFIAEMGLKRIGTGTFYLRNLRLEVYEADLSSAQMPTRSLVGFNFTSFAIGLGFGIVGCRFFLRLRSARSRANHERELRRIASLDTPQLEKSRTP